jgi:hypothetical protein
MEYVNFKYYNMKNVREHLSEINPDAIMWDGLDEAIVGITECGKAVYDIYKMELIFARTMSFEEASEWVSFNILDAYVGEFTPIHLWVYPKYKNNQKVCMKKKKK